MAATPASAQTVDLIVPPVPAPVEDLPAENLEDSNAIERVPDFPGDGLRRPRGPRIMKPGALLLASFDRDADAVLSRAEIDQGAVLSFAQADRNADGSLGGFEQSDWAASVGAADDVLSNPMLFDANLDRSVTQTEFAAGLHRLAQTLADPGTGRVSLANLTEPLRPQYDPADRPRPPRDRTDPASLAPSMR
mgnify:CR=1 FL=1